MSYSWNTFKETHISFIKQKTTILHSLELLNEFSSKEIIDTSNGCICHRQNIYYPQLQLVKLSHYLCSTLIIISMTLCTQHNKWGASEGRILKYYEWVKNFQDAFLSCNTFRPPPVFGKFFMVAQRMNNGARTTTKSYSTGLLTGARGVCVCVCAWKTCLLRLIWRELAKAYYIYTPLAVLLFMVLEEVCCCCFLSLVWSAKWCGLVMELRVGVGLGNNVVFVLCPWGPIKVKACCGTFFVKCKCVCVCVTVAFGPGYKTLKLWTHSVTYLR